MLCQTIHLRKTWKYVRLSILHSELQKVRKRMLKHFEKVVFWFRKEKATYYTNYLC